jgi:prepilin-type N-terminal cleavage/methylation domain-containing protein
VFNRIRSDQGYSLVELLTVMVCLGIVLAGLTTAFVAATRAESNDNLRFQTQQTAELALNALRNEVHCASAINSGWSATSITLTLPAGCPDGSASASTSMSWCTSLVSTTRYAMYRQSGATCGTSGILEADYLTTGSAFSYTCTTGSNLRPVLTVSLPVNVNPAQARTYALSEGLAFRNAGRC